MKRMLILMAGLLLLCGCSTVIYEKPQDSSDAADAYDLSFKGSDESYEVNGSTYISLGNEDVTISKAGTYILEGTLNDASIIVDVSKDDDVQLVLNGVTIYSDDFAGIYIVEGDEITITLAEGTVNTISDASAYAQIDANTVNALIYSKADLFLNGTGKLILKSSYNHGIVSKDDLIITGGDYDIDVAGQGLHGKDCLMISDGSFNIVSGKDAMKSDNDEDAQRGYVYITSGSFTIQTGADGIYASHLVSIEGGSFAITTSKSADSDSYKGIKSGDSITITGGEFVLNTADDGIHGNGDILISDGRFNIVSDDDGIHADGKIQIDGGTIEIEAHEGLEATYVLFNDGTVTIEASDDGINATTKSKDYDTLFEMNGGTLNITMGQGDTDGIDSNGSIRINGGTLSINAQFPFDYNTSAEHNGGTIIVNGTQTDEITNQFADGFGGMPGGTFPGGDFPGGTFPGGDFPGGEKPEGDWSFPEDGENEDRPKPGGDFPGGHRN